jgi:hypothetical protein
MTLLGKLQGTVQALHDVQVDLDVAAYVVDDATRREIPGAREHLPEQIFVREEEGNVEIALYIAPSIMARLEQDNPHTRLHAGNLEHYCIALEGVSHFVFLAWRASMGWPVSALEMEIQAEVDKFIAAWLLLAEQGVPRRQTAEGLAKQLFDSYVLRDALSPDEAERYHTATRVAKQFCSRLARRYAKDETPQRILKDAHSFYRTGLAQKLRAA